MQQSNVFSCALLTHCLPIFSLKCSLNTNSSHISTPLNAVASSPADSCIYCFLVHFYLIQKWFSYLMNCTILSICVLHQPISSWISRFIFFSYSVKAIGWWFLLSNFMQNTTAKESDVHDQKAWWKETHKDENWLVIVWLILFYLQSICNFPYSLFELAERQNRF